MLLSSVAHYNNLSDKLRDELSNKIKGFGKTVRYKFNISKPNPDPTKYNGETVWPNVYTLDPTRFNITDPYENTPNKSKSKLIALIDEIDEKGLPNRFKKIRIHGRSKGILRLDVGENEVDFNYAMFIELHPKLAGGMFSDKTKQQVITRIDKQATAREERELRTARKLAMNAASAMTDTEIEDFCDAMMWEKEDPMVLRNKIEDLAETSPEMFNDLIKDKKMKYQAAIKRGLDSGVLLHAPAEGKLMWASSQQVIIVLGVGVGDKSDIERFAEWFMSSGGTKGEEAFKKITSLNKKEVQTS